MRQASMDLMSADQILSVSRNLAEVRAEDSNSDVGTITRMMVNELKERRAHGDYLWSRDTSGDKCLEDSGYQLTLFLIHLGYGPSHIERALARELTLASRRVHLYGPSDPSLAEAARNEFVKSLFDYADGKSQLNKLGPGMKGAASQSGNIELIII